MNPSEHDLDRLARLARLALTPEEKATFQRQIADLLRHIERLSQVDVNGVAPPAHAHPQPNGWQEDAGRPCPPPADAPSHGAGTPSEMMP